MIDKITIAITLPINGAPWDRQAAISEAISAASMRGDKAIASWDVETACDMAHDVTKRYGATPYGFQFSTRSRGADDLDSKETARSPFYHLGGRIETLAEVEARNDDKEFILVSNMKCNGWDKIVVNDNSWRSTRPLGKDDVLLDWKPRPKKKTA